MELTCHPYNFELNAIFWNYEGRGKMNLMSAKDKTIFNESHIIGFYKTWEVENYSVFNSFSEYDTIFEPAVKTYSRGRGSGVLALALRKDFCECLHIHFNCENWIICSVRVKPTGKIWVVGVVYIKPGQENDSKLELLSANLELISELQAEAPLILGGDFNARIGSYDNFLEPEIKPCLLAEKRISKDKNMNRRGPRMIELLESQALIVLNGRSLDDPYGDYTFVNNNGASVIDFVLINFEALSTVNNLSVVKVFEGSHFPVLAEFGDIAIRQQVTRPQMIWKQENKQIYNDFLKHNTKPNLQYQNFRELIQTAARTAKMSKIRKSLHDKQWFDSECRNHRRKCQLKCKEAKKCNWDEASRLEYLKARQDYTQLRKEKSKEYWQSVRRDVNNARKVSQFWRAIKRVRATPMLPNRINENKWKRYYQRILPNRRSSVKPMYIDAGQPMQTQWITIAEVKAAIRRLSNRKAPGPDGIRNEFLKNLPVESEQELTDIYNRILQTESPPDEWFTSETDMLHKKGSLEDPENYRPIALINTMLKLFTQILQTRLAGWAEQAKV